MGSHLAGGGCGCQTEHEHFEPFQDTGGEVRVLIIGCNYPYSPANELTGVTDGENMERICQAAGCTDVTCMYDTMSKTSPLFPTAPNMKDAIQEIGSRTSDDDYFVLFYAGHGENLPDAPPSDEADGFDEAFVLPGPRGEIAPEHFLVDDDFVKIMKNAFSQHTRILFIFDCCHSATLADIDSFHWDNHRVCSISACQDHEESTDTGAGGLLTIAIDRALGELALQRGAKEYSLQSVFERVEVHAEGIADDQKVEMMHANLDPVLTPWPLPRPWWTF